MLKTRLVICLCSSIFLLLTSYDSEPFGLPSPKPHPVENVLVYSAKKSKTPLNRQGMLFVASYIKKSCAILMTIKQRSTIPFNIIDSVFSHYGLPHELKYLAVIESELKPSATSRVGALGPWQFMPATARILGLRTSAKSDERRNYYKSTAAAAKYLNDLHAEFEDWLLVIAAYNCGPRPVHDAILRSGSRNFWILQQYLPLETSQHVKKFIATHYYFEGQGSLTTLTKAETAQYSKMLNILASFPEAKNLHFKDMPKNKKESGEEKFKRLMKESEESLHRSNQMLQTI